MNIALVFVEGDIPPSILIFTSGLVFEHLIHILFKTKKQVIL